MVLQNRNDKKKMKALNIRPKFKIGDLKILELDCSFCIFFYH